MQFYDAYYLLSVLFVRVSYFLHILSSAIRLSVKQSAGNFEKNTVDIGTQQYN